MAAPSGLRRVQGMTVSDLSNQLADAVQAAAAWTVRVQARRGPPASGIVLSNELIVTADHVVDPQREDQIKLGLPNGTEVEGKLVGRDPATDVAIIRATGGGLTAPTAPAGEPRTGALAVVVASGLGFGGPGIAIPWSLVTQLSETIGKHGKVPRGYLGVGSQPIALSQQAKDLTGGQERGLLVVQVAESGPASAAGFLQGDILVKLDQTAVSNADDLQGLLGPNRVGSQVSAAVVRGGELKELTVTVGTRE